VIPRQFLKARQDLWWSAASAGVALVAFVVLGFCLNTAVRMPCHDVCGLDIGRMYEDHLIGVSQGETFIHVRADQIVVLRDGEIVELCWHAGEERVEYWHRIGEGYAGRKAIDWGE